MYERFTDRARKAMALANQESQRLGSRSVAREHILLGLLKEGQGVAAHVLRALDVSFEAIVQSIETAATPVPSAPPENQPPPNPPRSWWWLAANALRRSPSAPRLPLSSEGKTLIEQSYVEARALNHNYVGTEHLLLGLLKQTDGRAAELLTGLGLRLDDVRQEILDLLGHGH